MACELEVVDPWLGGMHTHLTSKLSCAMSRMEVLPDIPSTGVGVARSKNLTVSFTKNR